MDFSSYLTTQASPSMRNYSEKSILAKQINDNMLVSHMSKWENLQIIDKYEYIHLWSPP